MADVDQMLRDLPEESPPPEIVLSAVRSFRYRVIAIVASVVAAALLLVLLQTVLRPDNIGAEAARLGPRGVTPLLVSGDVHSVVVTLVEVIQGDGVGYVHFLVEEGGEEIIVEVEPTEVLISPDGENLRQAESVGQSFEVGGLDQIGGAHYGGTPDAASGWIRFEGEHEPSGPLAVEFRVWFMAPGEIDPRDGYEAIAVGLRIDVPGKETQ